ncbi:MAG TPA: glycosyltransferase [Nitrospirae bacterium]|nr:glycosyltransferase [Nitrospirota bacterium]
MSFNINKFRTLSYIFKNIYNNSSSNTPNKYNRLIYIVESVDWSIKWDGQYITDNLNTAGLMHAMISHTHIGVRNQIIHFGSFNTFFHNNGFKKPHRSNKVIVTCFHLVDDDPRLKFIREAEDHIDFFHTSCTISKNKLIDLGVKSEKIVVIPLGVDLSLFKPFSNEQRQAMKTTLGIPNDYLVIGSFQKDGNGWGEGLEPKLIKGPDLFVKVVSEIAKKRKVHCLLTGPARGYVKKRLDAAGISYTHNYLKNYQEIVSYYNCLDLYLITSREEGGPKALIESMATGTPVLSTKCGMSLDIILDGNNGFLIDTDELQKIIDYIELLSCDHLSRKRIVDNALKTVRKYNWNFIAKQYAELYKMVTNDTISQ